MGDLRDEYLLNLDALHLPSQRVQAAYKGGWIEAAAIEAHPGRHAAHDLHEACFKHYEISKIARQDVVVRGREGSVEQVHLFWPGSVGTPILEDLAPIRVTPRAPDYTLIFEEPRSPEARWPTS